MVIPIPGNVKRNNNVSVLALHSDVQPGDHHGNRRRISPGARLTFQAGCGVRASWQETQTAQQMLLPGLLLWSLLLSRRRG